MKMQAMTSNNNLKSEKAEQLRRWIEQQKRDNPDYWRNYRPCLEDHTGLLLKQRTAVFLMLNPATRDPANDHTGGHKTRTRCRNFARAWNCGPIFTVNLFGWRTPDPQELRDAHDPVGNPGNDAAILLAAHLAAEDDNLLICAWGTEYGRLYDRDRRVMTLVRQQTAARPMTLSDGKPIHPSRAANSCVLRPYA
jgi:hypothetical protein